MSTFIRFLYAILIAAAVVAFVGIGIYTFYPAPTAPTYPMVPLEKSTTSTLPTAPLGGGIAQPISNYPPTNQVEDYQQAMNAYNTDLAAYQRNVSIILVCFAVVIISIGLRLHSRSDIIGEGLSLGGIGTSIYAVTMASLANNRVMRFIAVTAFLASAIIVVYMKFRDAPTVKKPVHKH